MADAPKSKEDSPGATDSKTKGPGIEWNGKMITDPAELPPELRPLLEDANHNGIPDLYEQGATRPIIINGKLYRSVEEVPEPLRAEVEKALAAPRTGATTEPSVEISRSFTINGQSYASLEDVPAEHRERIRQAMSNMIGEKPKAPQPDRAPSNSNAVGSSPARGSHDRVGEGGLCPPEPKRGRGWEPSQGSHNHNSEMEFPWAIPESKPTSAERPRSKVVPWVILAAAASAGLTYLLMR